MAEKQTEIPERSWINQEASQNEDLRKKQKEKTKLKDAVDMFLFPYFLKTKNNRR